MSQEKLAELIGIGIPALSNIECGKSYPLETTFEKLIEVLNVKPYILYIDEEDFDLTQAYEDTLGKLDKLKTNKFLFKRAYDFINQLTQDL